MASGANGKVPTAHARMRAAERETAKAESSLAQVIGEAVALHLAQLLPQALSHLGQPGCLLCVHAHKRAEQAWREKGGEGEFGGPPVAERVTWAPFATAPNAPVIPAPLCYQHLSVGPQVRAVGLVDAAGAPIVTQA